MAKPLPQFIDDQLKYLFSNSPLQVKVDKIRSSSISSRYSDHFTLSIPFCLDYIKWDFMYNMMYPSLAPDIVFPIEDEEFNPLIEIVGEEKNSCLRDWNSKDPSKLLALVNEIRDLYTDYHKKRAMKLDDDRLQFEANTILTREGVEVCVTPTVDSLNGEGAVKFVIPLLDNINLNKLVPGCSWKRQQKIYLEVTFPVSKGYPTTTIPRPCTRLVPSPSDMNSLFPIEEVKLPQWVNGMCMAEYLPILEDNLQIQVVEAVASIGSRRRFIEALSTLFGRPVEVDPVFCRKATVFSNSGNFMFLVHFAIPSQFPSQKPVLTLESFQSNSCSPKLSQPIIDYPWSPRWNTSEMAQRIFDFLVDESLNFKRRCTEAAPC